MKPARSLIKPRGNPFLPPPVTQSDEEPIAAGGWQGIWEAWEGGRLVSVTILPPLALPSDEEPMAAGGR